MAKIIDIKTKCVIADLPYKLTAKVKNMFKCYGIGNLRGIIANNESEAYTILNYIHVSAKKRVA